MALVAERIAAGNPRCDQHCSQSIRLLQQFAASDTIATNERHESIWRHKDMDEIPHVKPWAAPSSHSITGEHGEYDKED
jgi:hypothetical protein